MNIAVKYLIFAAIATACNILTQKISLTAYNGYLSLYFAMASGTLAGLVVKYILDKNFIFYHVPVSSRDDAVNFIFYSTTGIFTTLIFWGFEIVFNYIWDYPGSKYIGALIGLGTGYFIKYRLDKKYVFKDSKTICINSD